MNRVAVLALGLLLPVIASAGEDPILQRQDMMEGMKDNGLKPLIGMSRGELEFDAEAVSASLVIMKKTATEAGALFPEGSETGHDTEALPSIWEDRAGFDQAMADFGTAVDAASEASPQSVDELKPALNGILKTCKGCHDNYRVEKE